MNMMNDTIAAIATANATGAVSIIRISGEERRIYDYIWYSTGGQ